MKFIESRGSRAHQTYIHTHTYTYIPRASFGSIKVEAAMHTKHTYIHSYIHTYIHTHTYTYIPRASFGSIKVEADIPESAVMSSAILA